MPAPDEKVSPIIGDKILNTLRDSGYVVVSEQESLAWKLVSDKFEFAISALYMIARKPIKEDPFVDAEEIRNIAEQTIGMMGIVRGATPFDNLRVELSKEKEIKKEALSILKSIMDSYMLDEKIDLAIRSILAKTTQ